ELGRVVAGIAEHQALVAGADVLAARGVVVDALGNVGALLIDADHDGAGVGIDAGFVVGVANFANDLADNGRVVDDGLGRDFAGNDRHAGGDHGFAGDAAERVLRQQRVEHAVRDLVGQL